MEKKSKSKSSRAATAKTTKKPVVEERATFENDSALNVTHGTRVATIVVSVVGMLFCAVFWPSVLDFKAKLAEEPSFDGVAVETHDVDATCEPSADETGGWREQLDALYPREDFSIEDDDSAAPLFPETAFDDPNARAARFNDFEPSARLTDRNALESFAEENLSLESLSDDASPLFAENDERPLPTEPQDSYMTSSAEETAFEASENDENPLLADLATINPDDPLGLDSSLPDATSVDASEDALALPPRDLHVASGATLAPGAPFVEKPVDLVDVQAPAPSDTSGETTTSPGADSRTGVSTARYDALVNSGSDVDSESIPVASSFARSAAYAAPVEDEIQANVDAPVEELESPSESATKSVVDISERIESETDEFSDATSVVGAAFAPSYFSRAVGLYGGQNAFSALYLARAARLVSDSGAWSPGSYSRVTPILLSNTSAPTREQRTSALERDVEEPVESEQTTLELESAPVSAETMRAKYPTLVGYVERSTVSTPAPLTIVGAPSQSTSATDP
ncbi:MAG: hypothetical protein IJL92_00865 [Thermoguttaceae bacterium]|nr:hypothetical protein [Thermoguttaceae bacterium]